MKLKPVLLGSTIASALLIFSGSQASAQTTPPATAAADDGADREDIVVTGSRIRQSPGAKETTVVVLDQAKLAQTGLTSVADVLQRLPGSAGGLNTKVNNSGNIGNPPDGGGVGAGAAEIDLRYLGARRTLVLVDGLRYVNGSSGSGIPASVDLNSIPTEMIDRIEVLQSAASPIYGSDAVAGVVNIITKTAQKGLHASAQFGTFRQGDGHTQDYNASYGIKGPTTSIVFGGNYVKQDPVRSGTRAISQFPEPGSTSCLGGGCSSATPLGRFLVNDFANPANTDGLNLTLRAPVIGRRPVFNPASPADPASDFKNFGTLDRFNFAPFNYILTPSERYSLFFNAKQELTSNINLRVKAVYNRRNSQNQAAFIPLFVGPDAGNGNLLDRISIDATNPFNPFGVTLSAGGAGNPPANYSFIARRLVEAGQRTFNQRVDTWSITGTLDGSFHVGSHKWYWDVNAVLGFADAHQTFTGNINAARLQQALGPVSQCTGDCVPFNIFGGVGSITAAQLAYVGFTEQDRSSQSLNDYSANLSGELIDLPAGPVGFAIGYEHRFQVGSFDPDPVIQAGLGADIPAQAARGSFNVDEVYGELRVPILADKLFFHSLNAHGAFRNSNYSTFGSNTTFTGGADWNPTEDFQLRGSYAQSFRAPSIGELFGSLSRFDQPIADPCSDINGTAFGTPAAANVRANCIANGVPANGSYQEPAGQLPVITGGNPNLLPEKSRTLLFGGTYSPRWARSASWASAFSLEANYYDIQLNGAIAAIGADVTLNRCAQTGDALSCASVVRTQNGFVSQINGLLQNIGTIKTRGIDLTLNYRTPHTTIGTFGLTWTSSWLLQYQESVPATVGFTTIERVGTERGSPDQAYPHYKSTAILDWALGDFGGSFTGRYISSVTEGAGTLGRTFYGDIQLSYAPSSFNRKVVLTLGVNNLFNQDPPPCQSCSLNNFDPTTYDVPGQFGYIRLAYKL
ncbi:MAG: TonB-dependent receptor [Sphingomonas sp.]|nr:TonB-dependent receptor [Sphingomonas sp.]